MNRVFRRFQTYQDRLFVGKLQPGSEHVARQTPAPLFESGVPV